MRKKELENFEIFLKGEFLTEAEDLAEKLEGTLSALAEDLDNQHLVDEAFRYVHTLKGGAMTVGFEQFKSYAHVFEQTLLDLCEGSLSLDQELANKLLIASDFFFKMIEALKFDFNAEIENKEEFLLALQPEPQVSLDEEKPVTPRTDSNEKKGLVLVVEDNSEMAQLTCEILADLDLQVEVTSDGSKAIERYVKGLRPDLIITDLKMPKMSGLDLIRRFKDIAPSIPFIVCSGFAEREDMAEFINQGAFGFLEKPVRVQSLVSLVTSGLRQKSMRDKLMRISLLNRRAYQQLSKIMTEIEEKDQTYSQEFKDINLMLDEVSDLSKAVNTFHFNGEKRKAS